MSITIEQAREALENMDDCARMGISVDPKGPYKVLKEFIDQAQRLEMANISYASENANLLGRAMMAEKKLTGIVEVGDAASMPGTSGFTMGCFKAEDVPVGTKLHIKV